MAPEVNESAIDLFHHRKSVALTPDNAKFFRSPGGLISMKFTGEDGSEETFERIVIIRAFPITNPDDFLSVREAGNGGRGDEIGLIEKYIRRHQRGVSKKTCVDVFGMFRTLVLELSHS